MTALFFSAIIRAPAVFSFGIHMFAVAFGTITGRPPSTVAAQLFGVPKSMPIVAMSASFRVEIA